MGDVSRYDCSIHPSVSIAVLSLITHCLALVKGMGECMFIPIAINKLIAHTDYHRIIARSSRDDDRVVTITDESLAIPEETTLSSRLQSIHVAL